MLCLNINSQFVYFLIYKNQSVKPNKSTYLVGGFNILYGSYSFTKSP